MSRRWPPHSSPPTLLAIRHRAVPSHTVRSVALYCPSLHAQATVVALHTAGRHELVTGCFRFLTLRTCIHTCVFHRVLVHVHGRFQDSFAGGLASTPASLRCAGVIGAGAPVSGS